MQRNQNENINNEEGEKRKPKQKNTVCKADAFQSLPWRGNPK